MSTRAVYTFKSPKGQPQETHHIYKHHDGYPSGAAEWIANAVPYAWKLPRFEASEFAAAFVAGNKPKGEGMGQGGAVYLTRGFKYHGDLEYRYEITAKDGALWVTAYKVTHPNGWNQAAAYPLIFDGTLPDFEKFANQPTEA